MAAVATPLLGGVPIFYLSFRGTADLWFALSGNAAAVLFAYSLAARTPLVGPALFGIFSLTWLTMAPFAQLLNNQVPQISTSNLSGRLSSFDGDLQRSAKLLGIGVAIVVSSFFVFRIRQSFSSRPIQAAATTPARLARIDALLGFAAVLMIAVSYISRDWLLFFRSRETLTSQFELLPDGGSKVVEGLLRVFAQVGPAVCFLILLSERLVTGNRNRKRTMRIFIAGVVVLWGTNPISSARFWMLTVLVAVLLTIAQSLNATQRAKLLRAGLIAALLASFTTFSALDYFRYEVRGRSSVLGTSALYEKSDFDSAAMTALGLEYVDDAGHSFGTQLASPLASFIPRAAVPNKPEDGGKIIGEWAGLRSHNLSAPIWIEAYMDFGWLGVIAISVFLAAALARISAVIEMISRIPGSISTRTWVLTVIFSVYQVLLLRGSLLQASFGAIAALSVTFISVPLTKTAQIPKHAHPLPT